ncbi:MAG: hypothetical protein ACOC9Q_03435 [bacterium]
MTEAEDGCPYDTREFDGGAERAPGSMAGELSIALEIARRCLDPPEKEDARAPGCQLVLLPESKMRLLAEIAYFRKNKKVMPSSKRYSRHSPLPWSATSLPPATKHSGRRPPIRGSSPFG